MKNLISIVFGFFALFFPSFVFANMKVATIERPPFVFYEHGELTGFSIDLLQSIKYRSKIKYDLIVEDSFHEMIDKVSNKEIDFAIANISITSEREQTMDFSHPIFDSGIHVLSAKKTGGFFSSGTAKVLFLVFFALIAMNIGMKKISSNSGTLMNIPTSAYLTVLRILGGGRGVLFFINQITPQAQASNDWSPKEYLQKHHVGVGKGTTFSEYLDDKNIDYTAYEDYQESLQALERGEVDVILAGAAVARYYAAHEGKDSVEIVGEMFAEDKLGIAIKEGKSTRKKLNKALLSIIEDGTYEKLMIKYFGEE